jgi:hypothetical protein
VGDAEISRVKGGGELHGLAGIEVVLGKYLKIAEAVLSCCA